MRKTIKKVIALCLVITMTAGIAISANAAGNYQSKLGALADEYNSQDGKFGLTKTSRIYVKSEKIPTGD